MANIESAVQFMINIANDDSHGYDQDYRNGPDYDCSSLVGTALNQAGFNVSKSSTTRTLRSQLIATGFNTIGINETRKRGDIFLKEGKHVVMCTDANNIVHASMNEKGTAKGGKTGDQTGKEICIRSFYIYNEGWDYHFRYKDAGGSVMERNIHLYETLGVDAQAWKISKDASGWCTLQCKSNGLYMDVEGAADANGSNIRPYAGNGSDGQKFKLNIIEDVVVGAHCFELIPKCAQSRRVDVKDGSIENSANIQIYDANGSAAQRWFIRPCGNGYYTFISLASLKSIDGEGWK